MNLTLLLMVRNEEKTIEDTLEHALACADHVVIVDTGSTDKTIELAKLKLESWCGPTWEIHEEEWIDYSWNRNQALGYANEGHWVNLDRGGARAIPYKPDWIFMLDGDCRLRGAIELRIQLEAFMKFEDDAPLLPLLNQPPTTAFKLVVKSGIRNVEQTRVFRAGSPWRYVGVVHEVAVNEANHYAGGPLRGVLIEHMGTDLEDKPRQWREHVALLSKEVQKNPQDMRSWFYLGQSFELLERQAEAFDAYYHCWTAKHGYWEERWEAGLRMVDYLFNQDDWKGCVIVLEELVRIKPWRAEGWYWLARSYAELKLWHKAYSASLFGHVLPLPDHDHYFVQPDYYGVKTTLLWMITCLYSGHAQDAIDTYVMICDKLTSAERIIFNQQRELTNNATKESRTEATQGSQTQEGEAATT